MGGHRKYLSDFCLKDVDWFLRRDTITLMKTPYTRNSPDEPTPEAEKLADYLRAYGWKPQLERWDGYKRVDIWIPDCRINIEVDGLHHCALPEQALTDLKRTLHSFKKGIITLRVPNALVREDAAIEQTARCLDEIFRESNTPYEI